MTTAAISNNYSLLKVLVGFWVVLLTIEPITNPEHCGYNDNADGYRNSTTHDSGRSSYTNNTFIYCRFKPIQYFNEN